MERVRKTIVFTLLCLQVCCKAEAKSGQYVYDYFGNITSRNSISDEELSFWAVTAKVIVQHHPPDVILKLEDVKTTIFNGFNSNIQHTKLKSIPEVSYVLLTKPFIFHPQEEIDLKISHQPDDPDWSVNMKRSIANSLYLNTEAVHDTTVQEATASGKCKVHYTVENLEDGTREIIKEIDHTDCEKTTKRRTNVQEPPITDKKEPVEISTTRIYTFLKDADIYNKIQSWSNFTYKSMPGDSKSQHFDQFQRFKLVSSSQQYQLMDVTENTKKVPLKYVHANNEIIPVKTPEELLKSFETNIEELRKYLNEPYLIDVTPGINLVFDKFLTDISAMDSLTLRSIIPGIMERNDAFEQQIFWSVLSHAGTDEAMTLIKDYVVDNKLNNLVAIKTLATFPSYINSPNINLIPELQPLMEMGKKSNVRVRNAGILAFANFVSNTYAKNDALLEDLKKYVEMFYSLYKNTADYELKMTYLLGLINMGNIMDTSSILSLVTDTNESHYLRSLAARGFKKDLTKDVKEVHENFWPVVTNKSEQFEVRVATLDVLLGCELSTEQFENIVQYFSIVTDVLSEKHLSNYFYTTLLAIQNTTSYYEPLGKLATETLQTSKIPTYPKTWSTGNYRMAFTDDTNFGASFETKLVANPELNVVRTVQLQFENFAFSFNMRKYRAHIRLEGAPNLCIRYSTEFKKLTFFLKYSDGDGPALPELVKILKKYNYPIINVMEDLRVEVVVFLEDRAVFSMYIDKLKTVKTREFYYHPLLRELLKLFEDYHSMSNPVKDDESFVSDLGTEIRVINSITDIHSSEIKNFENVLESQSGKYTLKYRSAWRHSMYIQSENPLIPSHVGTYKSYRDETLIDFPFSFKLLAPSDSDELLVQYPLNHNDVRFAFQWKNKSDMYNRADDYVIGTFGGKNVIQNYCSECKYDQAILSDFFVERVYQKSNLVEFFGLTNNITKVTTEYPEKDDESTKTHSFQEPKLSYKNNIIFPPVSDALLKLLYINQFNTYLGRDIGRYLLRTLPYFWDPYETMIIADLNLDFSPGDIISGTNAHISFSAINRRQNDSHVITHLNTTYQYSSSLKPMENQKKKRMEDTYSLEFTFESTDKEIEKLCVNRTVLYPAMNLDKLSPDAVEVTKAKISVVRGSVNSRFDACPNQILLSFKEIYTGTDKQYKEVKSLKEYKKCKEQSKGFKYTPPTQSCKTVHEKISRYDHGEVYLDISQAPEELQLVFSGLPVTDNGIEFLEYNLLNDSHGSINISEELIKEISQQNERVADDLNFFKAAETKVFDLILKDPQTIIYDDIAVDLGTATVCTITPNDVTTFYGFNIKNFNNTINSDTVAFVEILKDTGLGLTLQRTDEQHFGFSLWADDFSIIVTPQNGKLKVTVNGDEKHTSYHEGTFTVYFLDDDVLFVTGYSKTLQVYYNTEYISIKIPNSYPRFMAGLCAETVQ